MPANAPLRHMLQHHRKRQRRLIVHLGVAAVKRQSKRRLGKIFWAAGASLTIAIVLLSSFLVFGSARDNSGAKQPIKTTGQPVSLHETTPELTITAPATTAPEPTPTEQAPAPVPQAKPVKPPFTTPIIIDGDATCQSQTLNALELISDKAPVHYATVTKYIGVIRCVTQGSGMEAYLEPPRFLAGEDSRNAGTLWYAGTIVHDAGHSKLYHDYLAAHPGQSVPYDEWGGQNSEAICLDSQYHALQQMGAPQSTLEYIQYVITTEYWNIPYEDRWW